MRRLPAAGMCTPHACPALHPCPSQAGLHQLIMQQTYTQLPPAMPGVQGQFGQQLGLSASWLGSLPGQPSSGGAPQSSMGMGMGPALPGLETLSNMQQAMSSQVGGGGEWGGIGMGAHGAVWAAKPPPPACLCLTFFKLVTYAWQGALTLLALHPPLLCSWRAPCRPGPRCCNQAQP